MPEQAQFECLLCGLPTVSDIELLTDALHVGLDRLDGNPEFLGDFLVVEPLGEVLEHIALMAEVAELISADAVWVSKPRYPSFGLGAMAKRATNRPLILDVDDHDIGTLAHFERTDLSVDAEQLGSASSRKVQDVTSGDAAGPRARRSAGTCRSDAAPSRADRRGFAGVRRALAERPGPPDPAADDQRVAVCRHAGH